MRIAGVCSPIHDGISRSCPTRADVLIVGGGPAGLAAAIAARMKGLSVAVIDAARPPIDKPCGEGLMPDGVEALAKLGLRLGPSDSVPFLGIRFIHANEVACARFPGLSGRGVRRVALHALMLERAGRMGVKMFWNTPFQPAALAVTATWMVAADGLNSRVRTWAGFDLAAPSARRYGFRRHFDMAPWSDTVDVHWGRDCQIYVTPVGGTQVCVTAVSGSPYLRLDEALRRFPDIERRLRGHPPASPERGAVTECRRLRRVTRGNIALIGDASGSVDAITGEGLALAFRQAHALAAALADGDLSGYETAHRRIMRTPSLMANLMLRMDRRAWVRRGVMAVFARRPDMFSKLLRIHIGANAPGKEESACVQC